MLKPICLLFFSNKSFKDFKINFNTSEILGTNRDNKKTVYGFNITSKSAPIKNKFKKEAKGNKQKYSELFMGWILSLPIKQ